MMEMLSRIRAVLRRSELQLTPEEKVLRLQGICLDMASYGVYVDGEAVEVTKRELELLQLSCRSQDRSLPEMCCSVKFGA